MKIRQGFISNSSSSSFVGFIPAQEYNKYLNKLDAKKQDFIKSFKPEYVFLKQKPFYKITINSDSGELSINDIYFYDSETICEYIKKYFPYYLKINDETYLDEDENEHYVFEIQQEIESLYTDFLKYFEEKKLILAHYDYR